LLPTQIPDWWRREWNAFECGNPFRDLALKLTAADGGVTDLCEGRVRREQQRQAGDQGMHVIALHGRRTPL
jgi:hypothetical protein